MANINTIDVTNGIPTTGTGTVFTLNGFAANGMNVGGKTVKVSTTPTVTATNSYGANYVVGGLQTFTNAFTATGSGIIQSIKINMKKVESSGFTMILFDANPSNTTWTDAAAAAINAADVAKVKAVVALNAYSGLGTHTALYADGLGIAINAGATSLYGVLIANAALTNQFATTDDVTNIDIDVLQDV